MQKKIQLIMKNYNQIKIQKCIIDLLYYKTPEVDLEIDVTVVIKSTLRRKC